MRSISYLVALCLCAFAMSACVSGPRAFKSSHALHNEALRMRIDEEMLLNVVRLRYRDSPLFLQVGNVVTQFSASASASAGGSLQESGPDSLGIDARIGWSEQPTYTFSPLQDDDFVRRLLTPIDIELIVLLQRSGWSIERVLRLTLQNLGGLDNAASASGPTPSRAPQFAEFLQLVKTMRVLQQQGRLYLALESTTVEMSSPVAASTVRGADIVSAAQDGFEFVPATGSPDELVLTRNDTKPVLHVLSGPRDDEALQQLAEILNLAPNDSSYDVVVGAWPAGGFATSGSNTSIGATTRSLLGVLFYLSQGIDVPQTHVDAGLVTVTRDGAGQIFDWRHLTGDVFRIRSSASKPEKAAITVAYRGHWYYIEDQDLESKSTFALLVELFNMSSKSAGSAGPTLTLPVGG